VDGVGAAREMEKIEQGKMMRRKSAIFIVFLMQKHNISTANSSLNIAL
jgi:hypothetical protein